jgi:hypothetical protein
LKKKLGKNQWKKQVNLLVNFSEFGNGSWQGIWVCSSLFFQAFFFFLESVKESSQGS